MHLNWIASGSECETMKYIKIFYQFLFNLIRFRLTRVQQLMLVAVITGLVSGLLAVLLKLMVHAVHTRMEEWSGGSLWMYLFPTIGLLLVTLIVWYFFQGQLERGIAMVLRSIARRSSYIPLSDTWRHLVTSSLTVGFGGSAGLEAPIVATGAAAGSNIARISDLNYQERSLLIACGAAAGIGAVFNAPIAGVMFALEVLLAETVISYFIPLIISSVAGALCSQIILHETSLFNFVKQQTFNYVNVPFYILLGIFAGFVSLYYARMFKWTERALHTLPLNRFVKATLGGLLLALIFLFFPPLFGEGYNSIRQLANDSFTVPKGNNVLLELLSEQWILILFAFLIVLLKPLAAGITLGSGGNGGNFAPSLFAGAFLGFSFSKFINSTGWYSLPIGNFSLVGMAGVLSGVMYCPLTAIFLNAEITNGYDLFIPLMIVSSLSFFIVKSFEPYSMETKKLALEGQIFTHQKEKNILTSIQLETILQDTYEVIQLNQKLKDLVELIKKSDKNIFAVEDISGNFSGIIELNDIKQKLFQPDLFEQVYIRALMKRPRAIIQLHENMHSVMEKFDLTQSWYLPVLDEQKKFIGFISKTKLFARYREILSSQTDIYDQI